MKRDALKILAVIISVVFISLIFCGCTSTEVEKRRTNIVFKSDLVGFKECNLELVEKDSMIIRAELTGRVENKLNRMINIDITADFYDKDDQLLGNKSFTILGLREKNKPGSSTTFTITYKGEKTKFIDHVKVSTSEI